MCFDVKLDIFLQFCNAVGGYEQGTEQKYTIHMFDAGNEIFLKSQLKTVVRCSIIPEPELVVVS